ncbi:hypothetical protein ABZ797_11415 [Streptomyces antimycoticus]
MVIYSLKDLPTANPPGLVPMAPPHREDARAALWGPRSPGCSRGLG